MHNLTIKNPTITMETKNEEEGYQLVIFDNIGASGFGEILMVDDKDVPDADVCFATDELNLTVKREHLQRLFIALAEFFVGKEETYNG